MNNVHRLLAAGMLVSLCMCMCCLGAEPAVDAVRDWTDATGKYSIKAAFVQFKDGKIHLKLVNGKVIALSSSRLSDADQLYVRQLLAKRRKSGGTVPPRSDTPAPATGKQPSNQTEQNGSTFFQTIEVHRQPTHEVSGFSIVQDVQYSVVSRFEVQPTDENGRRQVVQKVVETRLVKADDLSRAAFEEPLGRLKGQQYTYTLNDRNEVIATKGFEDTAKPRAVKVGGVGGFQLTSVIDRDGWKELIELTFFAPQENPPGGQWKCQTGHDWKPLGTLNGATTFVDRGTSNDMRQVDFTRELTYSPPAEADESLPFEISESEFRVEAAKGRILFDPRLLRVSLAEEQFTVRGSFGVKLLGQSAKISLTEKQAWTIRLSQQDPRQ